MFGAMMLATVAFGKTPYPLHLSGVARFVFDLFMPALGLTGAPVRHDLGLFRWTTGP